MQERLAVQSGVLREKEASLQACEGQRMHIEAKAAVQHHQQQVITSRLEDCGARMAAEVHCTSLLFHPFGSQRVCHGLQRIAAGLTAAGPQHAQEVSLRCDVFFAMPYVVTPELLGLKG